MKNVKVRPRHFLDLIQKKPKEGEMEFNLRKLFKIEELRLYQQQREGTSVLWALFAVSGRASTCHSGWQQGPLTKEIQDDQV